MKDYIVCSLNGAEGENLTNLSSTVDQGQDEVRVIESCGVFGECVDGFCRCQGSWTTSQEFDFSEPNPIYRGQLCNTNIALHRGLFALNALVAMAAIAYYVQNRQYFLVPAQSIWAFIGFLLHAIYSLWRVVETDNEARYMGDDPVITLLSTMGSMLMYTTIWLLLYRYIEHEKHRLPDERGLAKYQVTIFCRVQIFFFGLVFSTIILFSCLPFVNPAYQATLIYCCYALWAVCCLETTFIIWVLFNILITQIQHIVHRHESHDRDTANGSFSDVYSNVASRRLMLKLKKVLPSLSAARNIGIIGTVFQLLLLFPTFFSATWMRAWKYFTILFSISFILTVVFVEKLLQIAKRIRRDQALTHVSLPKKKKSDNVRMEHTEEAEFTVSL